LPADRYDPPVLSLTGTYRVCNPREDFDRFEWLAQDGRAAQFKCLPLQVVVQIAADKDNWALQSAQSGVASEFAPGTILELEVKDEAGGLAGFGIGQEFICRRE
jgi:hypothetical protein